MRLLAAALLLGASPGFGAPPAGGEASGPVPFPTFGWRGDGSGRYPAANPPLEWSASKNVRWRAQVGKSYSSPVLTERSVLVTSEPGLLVSVDRATGKEEWKVEIKASDLADPAARAQAEKYKPKDTGMTAATPITDGAAVYVVLANGIVTAVDLSGKRKWTAFIDADQNTSYGRSASPALVDGRLIVHMTHLYAFDPATGKRLWVNEEARCTYGTPAGFKAGGVVAIVTSGGDVVRAQDGKGLQSGVGPAFHTSPVVQDGLLYFGDRQAKAVRLDAAWKDTDEWAGEMSADVFGSPVLHDGLLFSVTGKGELFAFDSKGTAVINGRMLFGDEAGADTVYASPTLAGKHLFLASNPGEIVVLEANREAKIVARNKLKDGSGSTPVFAGREVYLRDGEFLCQVGP
ncbi:MAG TPA: PQQ-binding-like beta-propeller repeat protein [Planctomycetota bacterium]|nr:PQQ-binding-like beta-propeller repeat protein [Planctomycetota bacterium]